MSNSIIAFLALGIIGGLGIVFVGIAFFIRVKFHNKISKCTELAEGTIVKHKFPGDSRVIPVVEYTVNNKVYRTEKKYNGYKKVRYPLPMKSDFWEDEKGYLCVKIGPAVNIKKIANEMWPIGSSVKVFYSSSNPKINYVDRPIHNGFLTNVFMISGILLMSLGYVMFIIIK